MNENVKIPAQSQVAMPAHEHEMTPDYAPRHPGVGRLIGKVALVTGGDSGVGRAVLVLFAREGAKVAIACYDEDTDAQKTKRLVEAEGSTALLLRGDRGVEETVKHFGHLDSLINNAAMQWMEQDLTELFEETLRRTFDSNVMGYFFCTQAALPHLKKGMSILNASSINAFAGNSALISYSSTRGASSAFSRSMAYSLVDKGISMNTVAPRLIWTPFISITIPAEMVEDFGNQVPMGCPGQPWGVATSFLFLCSSERNYYNGKALHPDGGMVANG